MGAPLLSWTEGKIGTTGDGASVHAAVLADDGTAATPPTTVFASTIEAHHGSGVFTGQSFLLAQREWPGAVQASGVAVVAVHLDGSLGAKQKPVPLQTEFPQLAWSGSAGGVVYNDFGSSTGGVLWAPLDGAGNAAGPPLLLSPTAARTSVRSPAVGVGGDAFVLLAAAAGTEARTFELVRVAASGAAAPYPVAYDQPRVYEYQLAAFGNQIVAAWIGAHYPGRIGLARLTP
jgi:hypothetical protein